MADLTTMSKSIQKSPAKRELSLGEVKRIGKYLSLTTQRRKTKHHQKKNVYSKEFFEMSENVSKMSDDALRMYIAQRISVEVTSSLYDMADEIMLAIIRGATNG